MNMMELILSKLAEATPEQLRCILLILDNMIG